MNTDKRKALVTGESRGIGFGIAHSNFYNKPVDNLITFEWQHSAEDFAKVINGGIIKIKDEIKKSKEAHKGETEK